MGVKTKLGVAVGLTKVDPPTWKGEKLDAGKSFA